MKKIYMLFSLVLLSIAAHAQESDLSGTKAVRAASYIDEGNSKSDNQDWQGAMNAYNSALILDPKNAPAYYHRAVARQNLKDYRGAIVDYSKAIYINNADGDSYYGRGICYYTIGDKRNCCFDLTRASEFGNNDAIQAIQNYCN